jgi:acetyl esterase/lipase
MSAKITTSYMLLRIIGLFLIVIVMQNNIQAQGQKPKLVTWGEIISLPVPATDATIPYGPDSLQYGELRLPEGKGPFPVVVLVHGGCWLAEYDLQYMSHLAEVLRNEGYATWNIEFRRVGDVGGGWPGTFLDVAKGTDYVRELAKRYPVNPKEVVVMGHSAGGHLALWLASRRQQDKHSPLYMPKPLKLKGVVSLAGITDLAAYGAAEGSCNEAVPQLMGGSAAEVSERYAVASPIQLLPLKTPTRIVQGKLDPIVPVKQAEDFTAKAKSTGDDTQLILLDNAGHFDLVSPTSPVFPQIIQTVKSLFTGRATLEIKN